MQFKEIDLRVRETNGTRVVEVDGYHYVQPESKPGEYRRVALFDLTEEQAYDLYDRLGDVVAKLDSESSGDPPGGD